MAKNVVDERSNLLARRITERLEALAISASEASRRAGFNKGYVRDLVTGRSRRNPTLTSLLTLAKILKCDVAYLDGTSDDPQPGGGPTDLETEIPIVGTVEAGVFREMSGPEPWLSESEFRRIRAPRNRLHPEARHLAFVVRGDSMNNASPRPIYDGDCALCIDIVDAGIPVTDGRIYVIRRTRDAGQSFEWTLKRARVFRDRIELVPESTNSTHKTFTIPVATLDWDHEPGDEIAVIGQMYALFASFDGSF